MNTEKRKPRSYKIIDSVYDKASRKAIKNGTTLSNVIEKMVIAYSEVYPKFIKSSKK